eukprot:4729095-Prymnesium_polylepis.1
MVGHSFACAGNRGGAAWSSQCAAGGRHPRGPPARRPPPETAAHSATALGMGGTGADATPTNIQQGRRGLRRLAGLVRLARCG